MDWRACVPGRWLLSRLLSEPLSVLGREVPCWRASTTTWSAARRRLRPVLEHRAGASIDPFDDKETTVDDRMHDLDGGGDADRVLGLLDELAAAVRELNAQPTVSKHRSWCVPAAHADGDDRCVSAALDASPQLSSWLVDRVGGPRVVVDAAVGGAS
ncbi:MAG: hypothetical protein ACRC35_02530 [Angustibacter sp.]